MAIYQLKTEYFDSPGSVDPLVLYISLTTPFESLRYLIETMHLDPNLNIIEVWRQDMYVGLHKLSRSDMGLGSGELPKVV